MKLIIDIDDDYYELVKKYVENKYNDFLPFTLIAKGTPLPKGYGRLIDAERYRNEMFNSRDFDFFKTLDMQPTIIESDKSESEDEI